jgi:AraC-like DNA-binding protein
MAQGRFKIFRCGMVGAHAVESDTRHVFPRHTHEQFGIGVIHRGAQKSYSGRGMVEAKCGDTITVNPGEVHDGAPIGDAGRSWRILYLDPPVVADAIADLSEGKTRAYEFTQPVIKNRLISESFEKLFCAVTSDPERTVLRREELFLTLLNSAMCERSEFQGQLSYPKAVSKAKDLIDNDPTAPITLADLARASGLSRFQVLRGFVRATGLTPHAYLVQRRIDVARRLIARGTPLTRASVESGFADQSHMTRIFVRTYGISPRVYADATI